MRGTYCLISAGSALLLAACAYGDGNEETAPGQRKTVPIKAEVTVSENEGGGHSFAYKAPFFDERGNFDFSKNGAAHNNIRLTFTITDDSIPGITFKTQGGDAIWVVLKKNVDPATGSPRGPYKGEQFADFEVSSDGRSLSVTDYNNDGELYRYGLRFDLDGKTVIDDPDGQNGTIP